MKLEAPEVRKLLADVAEIFDEHVLMTRSMKDIIWGYRDIMLNITKGLDPDWFYTDSIGYFMNVREPVKPCEWVHFQGKQLSKFHSSLPSQWGSTLKERIFSYRRKFFPLRVDPFDMESSPSFSNRKSQKLSPFKMVEKYVGVPIYFIWSL